MSALQRLKASKTPILLYSFNLRKLSHDNFMICGLTRRSAPTT